jgi:hypothetical protein
MITLLKITSKKRDRFSTEKLQDRIEELDEYQDNLNVMRSMIVNYQTSDFYIKGYQFKSWAIEHYHKFTELRKRYNI